VFPGHSCIHMDIVVYTLTSGNHMNKDVAMFKNHCADKLSTLVLHERNNLGERHGLQLRKPHSIGLQMFVSQVGIRSVVQVDAK
jgi:hypothetical protein